MMGYGPYGLICTEHFIEEIRKAVKKDSDERRKKVKRKPKKRLFFTTMQ